MTRPRLLAPLAAALVALALLAAPAARAEEAGEAGKRLAQSLLRQLAAHPPRTPVGAVAVSPPRDAAVPQAREVSDALSAALAAQGQLQLRDWAQLDRALADRVRQGALAGDLDLPALPSIQGIVVTEAALAADGKARVQVRLVAVPGGAALAADSATVDPAPEAVKVSGAPVLPVQSASIEITMRRMADALAAGFYKLPGSARYRRLAVVDFAEAGESARKRELGRVVAAELATNLRRDHNLILVERSRLGSVMAEMKLAQMGLVDAKQATDLGRLADAQALILGSVSDAGDRFLVDARIVSAEDGQALAAASEAISAASLVALSSDAVVLRSRRDAVFRSMLAPGWGQLYNREPKKGIGFAAAEAVVLGGALVFHLQGQRAEDQYHSKTSAGDLGSDPSAAAASLRRRADRAYGTRNTLLWVALGVWAVNVADAWYSGIDGEAALALAPAPGGGTLVVAGRF
jgi:TolB-like protein